MTNYSESKGLLMFRNYLITALNNLLKNKLFSFINIAGLSIGLAACILIALFVQDETSYDKHWAGQDRIYRINTSVDRTGGNPGMSGSGSELLVPALNEYFGEEIEASTQIEPLQRQVVIGDASFDLVISEVDADIANVFDFEVLAGDLGATLAAPLNIALNEAEARRLFALNEGATAELADLVDQVVTVVVVANGDEIRVDLRVGAIYRLPAGNSIIEPYMPAMVQDYASNCGTVWLSLCSLSFVKLAPGVAPEALFPHWALVPMSCPATGSGSNCRTSPASIWILPLRLTTGATRSWCWPSPASPSWCC
jgi:putative ABC transport system permease protein